MFQTFTDPSPPTASAERLERVRQQLEKAGIDGVLVPRADEHQGEYVPPCAERLAWATGFTGSAGHAVILKRNAMLFVDGRYTVQAATQVDGAKVSILQIPHNKAADWIIEQTKSGDTIGFDPKLHTVREINALYAALTPHGIKLKPTAQNLIDAAWGGERPVPPMAPVTVQPIERSGREASAKLKQLHKSLNDADQDATVLTLPDSIAWLFNIRGSDVAHNPVALAYAIVPTKGRTTLFIDAAKLDKSVKAHLKATTKIAAPSELKAYLKALRTAKANVQMDYATGSWWIYKELGGSFIKEPATIRNAPDPCLLPKAMKNEIELQGARDAHLRDGAAMACFLQWLDENGTSGITEIDAVKQLEAFRAEAGCLKEISFDTISGAGPNGAIVHYRVTEGTDRKLKSGELFLIDSGGQYDDGTTDITRTVPIGKPTAEMKRNFTLVLKGHIQIATSRFPEGTRGVDIDAFARRALWQHGLDYDHGTGHGVGSYLSVHEGPQSISRNGMVALKPGMIVSNEPGYYKEDGYGIRIENLVIVSAPEIPKGGNREMMSFETITLAPIDRRLIVAELLSVEERAWLNAYHARVAKVLKPLVPKASRAWLKAATESI